MKANRSYSHKELSVLFFPEAQQQAASKQLSRWIHRDPDLLDELLQAGYLKKQRVYSPLQVSILFEHLGKPEIND